MARKRKTTRRRKSKRPIVLQLGPPRKRNPPKRRKARRRRRRNPAGATVVNPGVPMVTYQAANPARRRRRRRRRNPGIMQSVKSTLNTRTIVPIVVGGGLGVVGISLSGKYLTTRVSPKIQAGIEAGVGLVGLPLVNKLYRGSGPYFTGFMVGSAISKLITPLLPWGGMDEIDAITEGTGAIEFVGDLGAMDDESGDEAAAGDGGLEDILPGDDGNAYLVDGLGILPPMPVPRMPRPLFGMLRRRGLLWLTRLGVPQEEIQRVVQLPPLQRRAALARLRAMYRGKRRQARQMHGARFARHPMVRAHPARRGAPPMRRGGMVRGKGARGVVRPKRGGKFGELDPDDGMEISGGI